MPPSCAGKSAESLPEGVGERERTRECAVRAAVKIRNKCKEPATFGIFFVNLRANIAKGERNGKTGNRRFACLDTAEPHLYYTNIN